MNLDVSDAGGGFTITAFISALHFIMMSHFFCVSRQMSVKFKILIFFIILQLPISATELSLGLRAQINSYRYFSYTENGQVRKTSSLERPLSVGAFIELSLGKRLFYRALGMVQNRIYRPNYRLGTATLSELDIHAVEFGNQIGLVLLKPAKDERIFALVGIQNIIRRYGTEVYQENIIPNTYYPELQTAFTLGLGYEKKITKSLKLSLGIESHFLNQRALIYEQDNHQNSFYVQVAKVFTFKRKNPNQYQCPNQF